MTEIQINENINLVFTPISYDAGMAGSQRLKNLVSLLSGENILCKNLVLTSSPLISSIKTDNEKVKIISYSKYFTSIFSLPFKVFSALKKFRISGKNVLYNYGYIHVQNLYITLIAKLLGYKVVVDIVEDNWTIKEYKNRWAEFRVKSSLLFFRYLNIFFQGVIVINDHLFDITSSYAKSKFKIIKVPISIDPKEYPDLSKQMNHDIFYGGSFGQKDGLDYLLSAFGNISEQYPNARLIITGMGSKRDMTIFQEKLNRIKNNDRVVMKGYVTRNEYIELLSSCAVCCVTRVNSEFAKGGFPFKLGEMLASGNPVISTRIGEVEKYLIDNSNAFLIDPDSEKQITDKIKFVFENRNIASLVGEQGKLLALNNFNLQKYKQTILNFFYNI